MWSEKEQVKRASADEILISMMAKEMLVEDEWNAEKNDGIFKIHTHTVKRGRLDHIFLFYLFMLAGFKLMKKVYHLL